MGIRKKKSLGESASEFADTILPTIETAIDSAKEKAIPLIHDAREKAAPLLAEGKTLAAEKATEARERAKPLIAEGRERAAEGRVRAAEKAAPLLAEGKIAAAAKVNELRGIEPEPKQGSKLKKLLFLGVLAGIGGLVFKKLTGGSGAGDNWQSSYVPAPAPAASTPSAPAAATAPAGSAAAAGAASQADRTQDDAAAASPDEALADAAEHPVPDTTPDNPAEVVDLDDKRA